jgi:hypothetical protein
MNSETDSWTWYKTFFQENNVKVKRTQNTVLINHASQVLTVAMQCITVYICLLGHHTWLQCTWRKHAETYFHFRNTDSQIRISLRPRQGRERSVRRRWAIRRATRTGTRLRSLLFSIVCPYKTRATFCVVRTSHNAGVSFSVGTSPGYNLVERCRLFNSDYFSSDLLRSCVLTKEALYYTVSLLS